MWASVRSPLGRTEWRAGAAALFFEPSGLGESRGQAEMFYDAAGGACHGPWTF